MERGSDKHASRVDEELKTLQETRSIYLHVWTFGGRTQPVLLTVEKPEVTTDGQEEAPRQ